MFKGELGNLPTGVVDGTTKKDAPAAIRKRKRQYPIMIHPKTVSQRAWQLRILARHLPLKYTSAGVVFL